MDEVTVGWQNLSDLVVDSHLMTMEQLPRRVAERAASAGLQDVLIYLSDLQEDVLRLLTGHGLDAGPDSRGEAAELAIEGTEPGRAYQCGQPVPASPVEPQGGPRWWVPLVNGSDRLGVLRVTTIAADGERAKDMQLLAGLVALMVVNKRPFSDSHARLVRTRPMNVAAEMQWHVSPPRTTASDRVVICVAQEPAYQISGDAYDYAFAADVVHLGIFDAMGHDTASGLTANLAVAACRNNRRQGANLPATSEAIERVLIEQFGGSHYTTAILADLDTATGALSWVNRGHHPPVIVRGGRQTVILDCPPAPPMGTDLGMEVPVCHTQIEPGDRLLLYTDGITEARGPGDQEFGLTQLLNFLIHCLDGGVPMPETLRRLIHTILAYHRGHLSDDATIMLLQWHGPTPFSAGQAEALVGLPEPDPG